MKSVKAQQGYSVRVAASTLRVVAGLVDLLIPAALTFGVCLLTRYPEPSELPPRYWNYLDYAVEVINASPMFVLVPAAMFVGLYVAVTTAFTATIGNTPFSRLVGVRVTNRKGERPGFVRAFFWTLSGLLLGLSAFVGPMWTIVDPRRRMLHDILCGVVVVFGRPVVHGVEADPDDIEAEADLSGPVAMGPAPDKSAAGPVVPWHGEGGRW